MGSLLSFNYQFFCLKNIGGAKELVVLLWLSGNIWNKQWIKSVGLQLTLVRIGFLLFCQIIIRPIYYISDRQVLRTFASRPDNVQGYLDTDVFPVSTRSNPGWCPQERSRGPVQQEQPGIISRNNYLQIWMPLIIPNCDR